MFINFMVQYFVHCDFTNQLIVLSQRNIEPSMNNNRVVQTENKRFHIEYLWPLITPNFQVMTSLTLWPLLPKLAIMKTFVTPSYGHNTQYRYYTQWDASTCKYTFFVRDVRFLKIFYRRWHIQWPGPATIKV